MKRNYFYIILLSAFLFSASAMAQDNKNASVNKTQESTIEGLSIYPNPTTGDKIYIVSKLSLDKEIEIFDVLGKRILQTTISSKELNIGNLNAGVYIIKIKEGEASATRKLIVK
ncbi:MULTISPECIES: T9SS type A sorting domain-containing protein [Flavobacterium]|uniref:T9SS type A sorting domain-containing protein n=1 Tax=Flavobacterium TaxID=237 RepID=UPI001FCB28A1|nr:MULTISPECIES: T9SS type A sorting domain-containing protein [Flavobacterium]UOK43444.1 T9SS type A sorting domain-containing protein [Flavobacterium enshiense]